jgi:tetratricopeptide (TPR) repeat protein
MKNLRIFFALVLLQFAVVASAQKDKSRIDKKAVEAYTKGLQKLDENNYKAAAEDFKEAIRRDGAYIDAYLSLAGVYGQLKDHDQCIATYEKAFAMDSNYTSDLRLPYSINLAGNGHFEKALATINALLARPDISANTKKAALYRKQTFDFAVNFAITHADNYVFTPRNLGDGVNTAEAEYFPSLPIDGNTLVFTRLLNNRNEDFFLSEKTDKAWDKAYRLKGSINTLLNEGAQNISQDGSWLIFTGCNRQDGAGIAMLLQVGDRPSGQFLRVRRGADDGDAAGAEQTVQGFHVAVLLPALLVEERRDRFLMLAGGVADRLRLAA